VLKNAFDLVFAFDEVVSVGGREGVTPSQVKMYTEMNSQEEQHAKVLTISKENEAREYAKQKQMQLAKSSAYQTGSRVASMGNKSMPSISSSSLEQQSHSKNPSANSGQSSSPFDTMSDHGPTPLMPNAPRKGMTLSKKTLGDAFSELGQSYPAPVQATQERTVAAPMTQAPFNQLMSSVKVEIDEQIKAKLEVEGGLQGEIECAGSFIVTVFDTSNADLACFKIAPQDQSFKYKIHPSLNKASLATSIIEVRDESKKYKANMPVPLLKWRSTSSSEDDLPIILSCWPMQTAEGTHIVLEYEFSAADIGLEDIHIVFPCPPDARACISSAEPGQAVYDAINREVHWTIPIIDLREGSCGTLEFNAMTDIASLFPYQFTAVRRGQTRCPVDVLECYHQSDRSSINFALEKKSTYILTVGA